MSDYPQLVAAVFKAFADQVACRTRPELEELYRQLTGLSWQRKRPIKPLLPEKGAPAPSKQHP